MGGRESRSEGTKEERSNSLGKNDSDQMMKTVDIGVDERSEGGLSQRSSGREEGKERGTQRGMGESMPAIKFSPSGVQDAA